MSGMAINEAKKIIQSRLGYFVIAFFILLLIFFLWPDNEPESTIAVDAARQASDGTLLSAIEPVEPETHSLASIAFDAQAKDVLPSDQENATIRDQFLQAGALLNQGRVEEAQTIYQQLITDYPQVIENHINLAKIYADQNKLEKARITLTQGLTANKNYAVLYANLQKIHGSLAAKAYRQAVNETSEQVQQPLNLSSINTIDTRPANADELRRLKKQLATLNTQQQTEFDKNKELQAKFEQAAQKLLQQDEVLAEQRNQISTLQNLTVVTQVEPTTIEPTNVAVVGLSSIDTTEVVIASETKPSKELEQRLNNDIAEQLVISWAKAWSDQNVNAYVQHYSDSYRPSSGGLTHKQWLKQRRIRLSNKGYINVSVNDFEIINMGARFIVNFSQHYRSDRLSDKIRKQLVFKKVGGDWQAAKIVEETIIKS